MSEDPGRPGIDRHPAPADDQIVGTAFRWSLGLFVVLSGLISVLFWWLARPPTERPSEESVVPPVPAISGTRVVSTPFLAFTDVSRSHGVDFVHQAGAYGLKLLPETMGGGAAFADFDLDGDSDLVLVNGDHWPWHEYADTASRPTHKLFLNQGDGRFVDSTEGSGLDVSFYGTAPVVGDFDGDRLPDLFVASVGEDHLFRNLGDGRFEDVSHHAGVAGSAGDWSSCGTFFDADGDQDLDLFVCRYVEWSLEVDLEVDYRLTGIGRAFGPPMNYAGTHSRLYRNEGDGTFSDVSHEAGIEVSTPQGKPAGKALAVLPADINEDGQPDLLVANDTVRNFLFINEGGRFNEVGVESGLAFDLDGHATGAMGMDTVVLDRTSGTRAIAIGNFAGEMTSLYLTQGIPGLFADRTTTSGIGPASRLALTFGVLFLDVDLDGRADLLQTNGHLEDQIHIVQDSQSYAQKPQLFWNCGSDCSRQFFVAAAGDLSRPYAGRGASAADIDGDGDSDLLITQVRSNAVLLRNDQQTGHHWIRVRLSQDSPNPWALGASVVLRSRNTIQERSIIRTRGYQSQVLPDATFGLGQDQGPLEVRVRWPDGATTSHRVQEVDQVVTIERNSGRSTHE